MLNVRKDPASVTLNLLLFKRYQILLMFDFNVHRYSTSDCMTSAKWYFTYMEVRAKCALDVIGFEITEHPLVCKKRKYLYIFSL